jgi:magnesium transporter
MFTIYHSTAAGLEVVGRPANGCWFNLVTPTPEDIVRIQQVMEAPQDFITHPLDLAEMPRTEKEDGVTLIVLGVPHFHGEAADIPYSTIPLGIIFTERYIATICQIETDVIREVAAGPARGLATTKHNRFILQLLWITANHYLGHLQAINKSVDELEDQLQHSMQNRELTGLLKYQKSLVYFITALKANELMLQHLQRSRLFQQYPDDEELPRTC